ncbi:MAG TPA: protein kinase [Polyangiaceae bacterium]|nr:protein kinase [Polyangiaceae bacterium]
MAVGGHAEVFLARPKLGSLPAPRLVLKRLLSGTRTEADFDVLEREATLHQAVRHPNVVKVYGAGVVGREPYLAMEYVEGVDLYRLLRRAEAEQRPVPIGLSVYVARQVAAALVAVHAAKDASGTSLGIVHRDVTPSNVYLSIQGAVKLGDFGIARVKQRPQATDGAAGLKGKFGYLAPEQVAGEPFDHRADLFSLAVLLGEMLIGERIFPGSGQLAVLLAIRDVNIDPLRRAKAQLPPGLFEIMERALKREPSARFADAEEFSRQLAPFENLAPDALRAMLSEWVHWAYDSSQLARRLEGQIRDSVQRIQAARRASGQFHATQSERSVVPTEQTSPCRVRYSDGRLLNSVPFPRLVELIATGDLQADDEVAWAGADFRKIRDIEEVARHLLPSTTATTGRLFQPGAPDYQAELGEVSMLDVLARMRMSRETGAVFVNDSKSSRRKEIYLKNGRLLHVASSERAELLGEYLVRRGALERHQLDKALTLLNAPGARLGDILVDLGWVEAIDVFRAIRDQGRDRVAALCAWPRGNVTFYRNTSATHVAFPLDLDLASPMMAGSIVRARGKARSLLPSGDTVLKVGPRYAASTEASERGTAPLCLHALPALARRGASIDEAITELTTTRFQADAGSAPLRTISENEACAALHTAVLLRWIRF